MLRLILPTFLLFPCLSKSYISFKKEIHCGDVLGGGSVIYPQEDGTVRAYTKGKNVIKYNKDPNAFYVEHKLHSNFLKFSNGEIVKSSAEFDGKKRVKKIRVENKTHSVDFDYKWINNKCQISRVMEGAKDSKIKTLNYDRDSCIRFIKLRAGLSKSDIDKCDDLNRKNINLFGKIQSELKKRNFKLTEKPWIIRRKTRDLTMWSAADAYIFQCQLYLGSDFELGMRAAQPPKPEGTK